MITLNHPISWHGPNPLSDQPVIVVNVTIADHSLAPLSQAIGALQALSIDWYQPPNNLPGESAAQALGAFLADWALQALTYVRGYLYSAGCQRTESADTVQIWLGFHHAPLSFAALKLGANWLCKLAAGNAVAAEFGQELTKFWQACRNLHPDYQARIIMEAARVLNIPYAPAWGLPRHWRFGQGAKSRVFMETSSCDDGAFASRIAGSKSVTKTVLRSLGLPTPVALLIKQESELEKALGQVGLPCVTKPVDGGLGRGVSTGLRSLEAAREGFRVARSFSRGPVLVEAFVPGNDYRLMVVSGRLQAVIRRDPPYVVGDGEKSLAELVAMKNIGRDIRSPVRSRYWWPIVLDASAALHLAGQGLAAQTVLAEGQRVTVRSNGNLSTGGDCFDVSDSVHPQIRLMAETLARTLNLNMMGADYQTTDIGQAPHSVPGGFIEINTTPGFSALMAAGWSAQRAGALALGSDLGRIATTLLVVPANVLAAKEQELAQAVWSASSGWASRRRAALAGMELVTNNSAEAGAPLAALLSHRGVERAVILYSDTELKQHGLPLDYVDEVRLCDVSLPEPWLKVINNHSGQTGDGFEIRPRFVLGLSIPKKM